MTMADPKRRKRSGPSQANLRKRRFVNKLAKQVASLSSTVEGLLQQLEDQRKRLDDLEYFRENAKELLDIQEIQDS